MNNSKFKFYSLHALRQEWEQTHGIRGLSINLFYSTLGSVLNVLKSKSNLSFFHAPKTSLLHVSLVLAGMRTAPAGHWAAALGRMQSRIREEVRRCWLTPCIPSPPCHWMPLEAAKLSLPPVKMQWDKMKKELLKLRYKVLKVFCIIFLAKKSFHNLS